MIASEPRHPGALHLLGVIRLGEGRAAEAAALIARSVAVEPEFAEAQANLGLALDATGRWQEAEAAFRRAIARKPDYVPAHLNLSATLLHLERPADAFEAARRAAELAPGRAEPHCNAGLALRALNQPVRAEAMFREALRLDPSHGPSLHDLGNLLRALGGRDDEALALLERALAAGGTGAETLVAIASLHRDRCEGREAAAILERAARADRDNPLIRLALALAPLQPLYRTEDERAAARAAYTRLLAGLDGWARAAGPARLRRLADALGAVQPFYLPYAGTTDRDDMAVYGRLAADATRARYGDATLAPPPARLERIRLGIVSGFIRDHSNWKIPIRGWAENLDRARFELAIYHTGEVTDAVTDAARELADRFHQGPHDSATWRRIIEADAPHVLLYPETGMDGASFRLAAMRLAPLQCTSWGHPETSGLPTMDLFLSSALMEPPEADAHYTERLVRLPGLGVDYRPVPVPDEVPSLPALPDGTRFFCGQALFKYLPADDDLLVEIASALPDARFVFVESFRGARIRTLMQARLRTRFEAAGLDADRHCTILDRQSQASFVALAGRCDVVLDAPSWSGCNSTLECLAGDPAPFVTLDGPTMRARHGTAILAAMAITDGIARDRASYVAEAVRLGRDPALRQERRQALRTRRHRVYADTASIRALEAAIVGALGG